jgi:hypothetical protein
MDRRVKILILDEFLTPDANDKSANTEIQVQYKREHSAKATPDGTPEWRDCTEVLIEGLALTIRDSLLDSTLCEHATELLADRLQARVKELLVEVPGIDSKPYKHLAGVLNIH